MVDDFLRRIPPNSMDAEMGLLGSIILSGGDEAGRKFDDLMAMLSVECLADEFYSEHNRLIYQAIMDLWNDKSVVDVVTIQNRLGGKEQLERVGGARYLADLAAFVPTAGHARAYAAIVREKAVCRSVATEGTRLAAEAYDGIVGDMLQRAESTFNKIADRAKVDGAMISLAEVVSTAIADTVENRDFACKTGLPRLDKMLQGGLYRGELNILAARPSKGKAQPLSSRVLTPHGWCRMGELKVGDFAIGRDGQPTKVEGIFPQGLRSVYRVRMTDGGEARCTDEHLWWTNTRKERKRGEAGSVKSLKEIRETLKADADQRLNHSIPWVEPVQFASRPLPLPPYLMGVYLGDGCLAETGGVRFSNPEKSIQDKIIAQLPETDVLVDTGDCLNFRVKRKVRNNSKSATAQILTSLGLAGRYSEGKFVPEMYLINSVEARLELLRGLLDADGYVGEDESKVEFTTTSALLCGSVMFLVGSLGGRATYSEKVPTFEYQGERKVGQLAYRMQISFKNGICPVSSEKHLGRWRAGVRVFDRFIESIEPDGVEVCQCIKVANAEGLYVTDAFIVTHNTALALQMAVKEPRGGTVFVSLEMNRQQLMRRAVSIMADVDWAEVRRRGGLEHSEAERAQYAADEIAAMNLEVLYQPRITPREVRAFARACANRWDGKLDLIVVDYLQLMQPDKQYQRRDLDIGSITSAFKIMAGELDVPVLLLSQLTRSLDKEGHDQRPHLGQLKESGSIEADADNVMFLWSEVPKKGEMAGYFQSPEDDVNLIVAKQRNGPTGQEGFRFEKRYCRFY